MNFNLPSILFYRRLAWTIERRIKIHVSNCFCVLPIVLQNTAIKDMASNVERRWRQMVTNTDGGSKLPDGNTTEGQTCHLVLPTPALKADYFDLHRFKNQKTET